MVPAISAPNSAANTSALAYGAVTAQVPCATLAAAVGF